MFLLEIIYKLEINQRMFIDRWPKQNHCFFPYLMLTISLTNSYHEKKLDKMKNGDEILSLTFMKHKSYSKHQLLQLMLVISLFGLISAVKLAEHFHK